GSVILYAVDSSSASASPATIGDSPVASAAGTGCACPALLLVSSLIGTRGNRSSSLCARARESRPLAHAPGDCPRGGRPRRTTDLRRAAPASRESDAASRS